jgi:hypothetical protein
MLGIHRAEEFADDVIGILRSTVAHLIDGGRKQVLAAENIGIFGEESENQAPHELVHVLTALFRSPVLVLLQQLDIELV